MRTQIGKWGNSLAIRIPAAYAKDLGLADGMEVEVSVVDHSMVVSPSKAAYTLEELVAGITPKNRHSETDWGPPVGREVW
jgi:antitoxin MazE